ncbi:MAG: helix-turn-helix domain-containing protein [Bacteroidota bacterium]
MTHGWFLFYRLIEIAFQTGFNDPSYLSKFFHKHTSLSPKEFRELF